MHSKNKTTNQKKTNVDGFVNISPKNNLFVLSIGMFYISVKDK